MTEEEFLKKLKDKKIWWCPLPWTHIFSSLSGRFAPCYDALAPTGHNMKNTKIREWYTSDYQNKLRAEMLKENYDGKFFDHHCTGCRKHEKLYGRSDRQKYVEQVLAGTFDNKVPQFIRSKLPVFETNGEIFYVYGLDVDTAFFTDKINQNSIGISVYNKNLNKLIAAVNL